MILLKASVREWSEDQTIFSSFENIWGPGPWGTTPLNGTVGDPYDLPFRQTGGLKCTQQAMSQLSPNYFGAKHRLMSAQSGRPDINQYCLKIDWNVMS